MKKKYQYALLSFLVPLLVASGFIVFFQLRVDKRKAKLLLVNKMKFLSIAYAAHEDAKRRPPSSLAELAPYLEGSPPEILAALQSEQLVVQWGATLNPNLGAAAAAGTVLAHWDDPVLDGGVCVLAQNGASSIWSRQAFDAAPKAQPAKP
jgi:hypothetical protein